MCYPNNGVIMKIENFMFYKQNNEDQKVYLH